MTTLASTLAQHNISADDLEKAASVRIFQKVASAENIDLSQLAPEQLEELYAHFEANVLPAIVGGGEPSTEAKIASLSEDDLITLFNKQASAEGLDLSGATEEQLSDAFGFFLENILPVMAENGFEPVGSEKSAEVEEAQAKLAEADILGRQMARGYADELAKIAGVGENLKNLASAAGERGKQLLTGSEFKRRTSKGLMQAAREGGVLGGEARKIIAARAATGTGLAATGAGLAAFGAKKLMGGSKEKEASVMLSGEDVSVLVNLAASGNLAGLQKAASLIKSASVGEGPVTAASAVDVLVEERATDLAAEWLTANGYGS